MKLTDIQARGKACEIVALLRDEQILGCDWDDFTAKYQEEFIQKLMEIIQDKE